MNNDKLQQNEEVNNPNLGFGSIIGSIYMVPSARDC